MKEDLVQADISPFDSISRSPERLLLDAAASCFGALITFVVLGAFASLPGLEHVPTLMGYTIIFFSFWCGPFMTLPLRRMLGDFSVENSKKESV